jgi:SAM-dependent methyltransferase
LHDELAERSRAIWGTGDYAPTSRQLAPASHTLVETLDIAAEHRVLDIAAGHGNCAIAAARRGATVVASDFSPTMIAIGRTRCEEHGLPVTWEEADAAHLPFADASFDRVTSVFGAIFALAQERVAAEAVRVVRPGGRIGFTAWTPDGLTARVLAVARRYGPPRPPDAPDPFRWGDPDEVRVLFGPLDCEVETHRRTHTFRYGSWEQWKQESEAHGMAVVARQSMPAEAYAQMRREMQEATAEHDYGEGDAVTFDADYLEIVVTRLR